MLTHAQHLGQRRPDRELDQPGVHPQRQRALSRRHPLLPHLRVLGLHDGRACASARCRSSIRSTSPTPCSRRSAISGRPTFRRCRRCSSRCSTIRRSASTGSSACACSTAAARRARSKCMEEFERAHRPAAERRLRVVGDIAGDPLDAAARAAQAGHHRPAVPGHRHEDRRRRDRRARAAARRSRRTVRLRPAGDEGLLEQARRKRQRPAPRRQRARSGSIPATSRGSTRTATRRSSSARRT